MALSISQTRALDGILHYGMFVASYGYPDMIAPPEMIEKMLQNAPNGKVHYRPDSESICKRHGLQSRPIPDAGSFFRSLGCSLDVYDIVEERGGEIICDLNLPTIPRETYDIVLDVGTLEHVFNIAQAIKTMAGMVRVGGYIIHENPFNCANHGFYNLNPTFFVDFYSENGFEVLSCQLATREGQVADCPPVQRFKWEGRELNIFVLARRVEVKEFTNPTQTKYKPAAGVRAKET